LGVNGLTNHVEQEGKQHAIIVKLWANVVSNHLIRYFELIHNQRDPAVVAPQRANNNIDDDLLYVMSKFVVGTCSSV
jgi:hypothetical protein